MRGSVTSEQPGWGRGAHNGCFQQTGAHCPETPSRHLGTVEPFHPAWPGPYIMIFYSAGKLMMRLYLETFQHYNARDLDSLEFRLKIGLSDIAYTLP